MAEVTSGPVAPTAEDIEEMHELYRQGGQARRGRHTVSTANPLALILAVHSPCKLLISGSKIMGVRSTIRLSVPGGTTPGLSDVVRRAAAGFTSLFGPRPRLQTTTRPDIRPCPTTGTPRRRSFDRCTWFLSLS